MAKRATEGLTAKQEEFCLQVARGANLSEAYRLAFDTAAMQPAVVNARASELAKVPALGSRIRYLQGEATRKAVDITAYSLAAAIDEADVLRDAALNAGNHGAAVSAATLKAKLAGLLVERKEVRSGPLEDADVRELQRLRSELASSKASEQEALELVGAAPSPAASTHGGNRPTSSTIH